MSAPRLLRTTGPRLPRITGPRFTARGAGIFLVGVAVLVAAVRLDRHDLLAIGLILVLLPSGGLAVVAATAPSVGVERVVTPAVVAVGDDAVVDVEFSGAHRRFTCSDDWREPVPEGVDDLGGAGRSTDRAGRMRARRRVRPYRRGVFTLPPVVVDVRDVFGFARRDCPVGHPTELIAVPSPASLESDATAPLGAEGENQQAVRRLTESVDELSAREYRPGDPLRRVHWRATARFGELMVRQEEQGTSPQAWIVLDTATPPADPVAAAAGADVAFERMVRMLAALASQLLAGGHHVGVAETGARQLRGGVGASAAGMETGAAAAYPAGRGSLGLRIELASIGPAGPVPEEAAVEPAASLHRSRGAAPVYALLRGADAAGAARLRAIPALTTSACAFVFDRLDAQVRRELLEAGWRLVPVEDDDLGAAWRRSIAGAAAGGAGPR